MIPCKVSIWPLEIVPEIHKEKCFQSTGKPNNFCFHGFSGFVWYRNNLTNLVEKEINDRTSLRMSCSIRDSCLFEGR